MSQTPAGDVSHLGVHTDDCKNSKKKDKQCYYIKSMIECVDTTHTYVQVENCGEPISSHPRQYSQATISRVLLAHTFRFC